MGNTNRLSKAAGAVTERADTTQAASLVLIHPPMSDIGKRRQLGKSPIVVGRDETADFMVARGSISRRHAELRCTASGDWLVADMGSTNGTLVNEEQVEDGILEDGDHVQFGDAVFKFVAGASAQYHDQIYALTVLDGPTSVHNERYFRTHCEHLLAKAQRRRGNMSLVVIDVDWLAEIIDERGELCGDSVLRSIAGRIREHSKSSFCTARFGRDGFAILMPGGELDDAHEFAEAIREAVECEPFAYEGSDFEVSISGGVAASAEGEMLASQLIDEAQKQLRSAKENGRNCIAP